MWTEHKSTKVEITTWDKEDTMYKGQVCMAWEHLKHETREAREQEKHEASEARRTQDPLGMKASRSQDT